MSTIKVLVVDDHALIRRGIIAVLADEVDLEIVDEASDGLEAIEKARKTKPDIVLMDLNMPRCNGLEATQGFQIEMPDVRVLILTVSEDEADLFSAIKFGARGYILKDTAPEELVYAISYVAQGGVLVSPVMANKLLKEFQDNKIITGEATSKEVASGLSLREVEVLKLVAQGSTNKQIADSLFISENTVKTHLRNILDKLQLTNRSQAAAYALKKGIIRTSD